MKVDSMVRVPNEPGYLSDIENLWYESSSEDEDYDPKFDNEDYVEYGLDEDWLGDMEVEFNALGQWIGGVRKQSSIAGGENEAYDEDNEAICLVLLTLIRNVLEVS